MSSSTFSANLRPDSALRHVVTLSGIALAASGGAIILAMPLHPALKTAAAIAWLLLSIKELATLRRGFADCKVLRLSADGQLSVLDARGKWQAARILAGTVVLRRFAWIRCSTGRGRQCAELLRGDCRESCDWRRLQVIWQHIGGAG